MATVSPAWHPGEAYFAGKRARKARTERAVDKEEESKTR
jgi:hypothetical protein